MKQSLILISSEEEALFFCNTFKSSANNQMEFLALLPHNMAPFEKLMDEWKIKTIRFSNFWHWSAISSLEHLKRWKPAKESLNNLKRNKNFCQMDNYHKFSLLELLPVTFLIDVYCKMDTYKNLLQIIRDVDPKAIFILNPNQFVAPLLLAAKEKTIVTIFIQISPDFPWQYKNSFYLELFDKFYMMSYSDKKLLLQLGVPEKKISILTTR